MQGFGQIVKKLGYALLGLLGALLLALLVAPSFIDWNSYTRRLAQEFQARTGHELDIAGELELSMLPAPTLVAHSLLQWSSMTFFWFADSPSYQGLFITQTKSEV